MNALEKIETLLINNGIPNQNMINYLVDKVVDDMVEKVLTPTNKNLTSLIENIEPLFKENETLVVTNNTLQVFCKVKDFHKVFNMISSSLERYYPYITIDDKSDPFSQFPDQDNVEEYVDCVELCLKLEITPKMKKTILLTNQLNNTLEEKTESKLKMKL